MSVAQIFLPSLNSVNPVITKESAELASQPIKENKLKTLNPLAIHTALTPFSEADSAALAHLLSAGAPSNFTTQTFRGRQVFAALFVNQTARGRFQVQVPENGDFNLRISEGPRFDIVDANATDGEAHIVMPAATFETVFHLQRNRRANTVLKVKGSLYNVQDELTSNKYKWIDLNRFLGLGKRPVPVPASWQSDDGADLVLNFEVQNLEGFQMLWYEADEPADFPPGIAEIGSAGGVVELPGVGRLEVPAGALADPTVIRLKELTEVYQPMEQSSNGEEERNFASSAVKVYPENYRFARPVYIQLDLHNELVGQNDPFVTTWSIFINSDQKQPWLNYSFDKIGNNGLSKIKIIRSGTYARTMSSFVNSETIYELLELNNGLRIQQVPNTCGKNFQPNFVVEEPSQDAFRRLGGASGCFLPRVFDYYTRLFQQAGGNTPANGMPIYVGGEPDEKPRTFPRMFFLQDGATFSSPYFKLSIPIDLLSFEETLAHELWHTFQYVNTLTPEGGLLYYLANPWLLEGPAVHMGAKATLEYGAKNIPDYRRRLENNQSEMPTSIYVRDRYNTAGFFSFYAGQKSGELSLAELAVEYSSPFEEMYALNRDFGYRSLKKDPFLIQPPEIDTTSSHNLSLENTRQNPLVISNNVGVLATNYRRVRLERSLRKTGKYKLLVKVKDLDGTSFANVSISDGVPSKTEQEYALGESFTEIDGFEGENHAIVTLSTGSDKLDESEIHLALEQEDKSRVSVETSSEHSIAYGEPVKVKLSIKDVNGDPLTGRIFIGLDKPHVGTFRTADPIIANGAYSSGQYVDVEGGQITLEYLANFTYGDSGRYLCKGGSPCKAISARLKVANCDFISRGKDRCPVIGPGKDLYADLEESDEGRIYSTWLEDYGENKNYSVKANGGKITVSISGLKDSAGRGLPDGFRIHVNGTYWGQLYDGTRPVSTRAAVPIQGGSATLIYEAPYGPDDCWPYSDNTRDLVVFDDSASSRANKEGVYRISIKPRKTDCD